MQSAMGRWWQRLGVDLALSAAAHPHDGNAEQYE